MEEYERAVMEFLESWKRKPVIGAIICGSYVTGNPSKHSDIDLQIILKPGTKWRERGNKIVNGFLIEYFANPPEKIRDYFRTQHEQRRNFTAHMFYTGKVVFGNREVEKLVKEARKWLKKPFRKMRKFDIEASKYRIWDIMDNLEEIYERGKGFDFVFHNSLYEVFREYSRFLGYPDVAVHKVLRLLTSRKDMKKYMIPEFPDRKFVEIFVEAVSETGRKRKMELFRHIVSRVHRKMGGFELDGWRLRSKT